MCFCYSFVNNMKMNSSLFQKKVTAVAASINTFQFSQEENWLYPASAQVRSPVHTHPLYKGKFTPKWTPITYRITPSSGCSLSATGIQHCLPRTTVPARGSPVARTTCRPAGRTTWAPSRCRWTWNLCRRSFRFRPARVPAAPRTSEC